MRSADLSFYRRFALLAKPHNLVENALRHFPLRSLRNFDDLFVADNSNRVAVRVESHTLVGNIIDDNGGEILRHEMNNPLTGILGNAELLLAEVRRKNDGRLPNGGQQRLETIAALAVRLRETVRRLSQECEARPAQ